MTRLSKEIPLKINNTKSFQDMFKPPQQPTLKSTQSASTNKPDSVEQYRSSMKQPEYKPELFNAYDFGLHL